MVTTNYFVCTLGEAAARNVGNHPPRRFQTVNSLVDIQAEEAPNRPAVAFPVPVRDRERAEEWGDNIFTFEDLRQWSIAFAKALAESIEKVAHHQGREATGRTVALLCPSSPDFLFTWLGLIRLGFSVLLIAPESQPSAVAHLCETCAVSILFYDEVCRSLAIASASDPHLASPLALMCLQEENISSSESGAVGPQLGDDREVRPYLSVTETDVAYLHHTSGTSTGLPKPIPQSHRAAVGVLPVLDGRNEATFTTTPLYHAGVADCFRAWTSGALIWLFPGKEVPITTSNVLSCLKCAVKATSIHAAASVKYFSSVPYVLQMVAADRDGLRALQRMDLVGVGGAALPPIAGDELVKKGVKLLSRFGTTECGFLMSSHRDYDHDKEWQYLRCRACESLSFEPQACGLAELVILPNWPHVGKRNRGDGSFATADLFEPHPTTPNAWKYHSRADSQLTLGTGKKFDPAPFEDAIATSPLLNDVLIFGNGKQYPGALLFRSKVSAGAPTAQLLDELWPLIDKLNSESQKHTELSRSMLVIMPFDCPRLEKSSKGTVLRRQAEKKFEAEINRAYRVGLELDPDQRTSHVSDHEVPTTILGYIKTVLGAPDTIPEDADLFTLGLDSVACLQIRNLLQKLLSFDAAELPLNVVYDCGSIKRLSQYILNIRKGQANQEDDEIQLMRVLAEKYSSFTKIEGKTEERKIPTDQNAIPLDESLTILTGATGALGAHILNLLRSSFNPIICLVRASSRIAARARINKSLTHRCHPALRALEKIICLPTKFSDPRLGLSPNDYALLVKNTTLIIHSAWAVNFTLRLPSFEKEHIAGLAHLLSLAIQSPNPLPPRFLFCSSVATVLGHSPPLKPIPERISHDPTSASVLGYSRSKWVAEQICERAHTTTRLRGRIAVLRIGQLCGDTELGIWNMSEAWPLMLSSVSVTHSLPRLEHEKLAWLPVNVCAAAVLEIALSPLFRLEDDIEATTIPVLHLVNPDRTVAWSDLLGWIARLSSRSFDIVDPKTWVQRLERLTGDAAKHPARKLLELWRAAYCCDEGDDGEEIGDGGEEGARFAMEETRRWAPRMGDVRAVDGVLVERIWAWLEGEMGAKGRERERDGG